MKPITDSASLDPHQLAHDMRTPIAALLAVESQLDSMPHDVRALMREAICRLQAVAERCAESTS